MRPSIHFDRPFTPPDYTTISDLSNGVFRKYGGDPTWGELYQEIQHDVRMSPLHWA
jgi:hypothetical protein